MLALVEFHYLNTNYKTYELIDLPEDNNINNIASRIKEAFEQDSMGKREEIGVSVGTIENSNYLKVLTLAGLKVLPKIYVDTRSKPLY